MNPNMNPDFNRAAKGLPNDDWLNYLGQPPLYDGGLFVTRTDNRPTQEQERQTLTYLSQFTEGKPS